MLPLSYTAVQNQSYGLTLGAIFNDIARLQNRQQFPNIHVMSFL